MDQGVRTLCKQEMLTAIKVVAGQPLPTEFLLFKFGENQTSKGVFTLTPESATACMAAYAQEGVRRIVDLNHDSLNEEALITRSDAGDARAWFSMQLRSDGIWATNVDWTPDGERRLREKTQAYISPAFEHDEAGVVWMIENAALVARPATFNAPALVAASRSVRGKAPYLAQMKQLGKALVMFATTSRKKAS